MKKYYTVFDGRPNEHFGADLRVGIAIASSWYEPEIQKIDPEEVTSLPV